MNYSIKQIQAYQYIPDALKKSFLRFFNDFHKFVACFYCSQIDNNGILQDALFIYDSNFFYIISEKEGVIFTQKELQALRIEKNKQEIQYIMLLKQAHITIFIPLQEYYQFTYITKILRNNQSDKLKTDFILRKINHFDQEKKNCILDLFYTSSQIEDIEYHSLPSSYPFYKNKALECVVLKTLDEMIYLEFYMNQIVHKTFIPIHQLHPSFKETTTFPHLILKDYELTFM